MGSSGRAGSEYCGLGVMARRVLKLVNDMPVPAECEGRSVLDLARHVHD
jgi:hypothetical protein